jgi:hypothetical protein
VAKEWVTAVATRADSLIGELEAALRYWGLLCEKQAQCVQVLQQITQSRQMELQAIDAALLHSFDHQLLLASAAASANPSVKLSQPPLAASARSLASHNTSSGTHNLSTCTDCNDTFDAESRLNVPTLQAVKESEDVNNIEETFLTFLQKPAGLMDEGLFTLEP